MGTRGGVFIGVRPGRPIYPITLPYQDADLLDKWRRRSVTVAGEQASIEELLKQHRALIEAELATKATNEAILQEKQKLTLLEKRRVANIEELLSSVGQLIVAVTEQNKLVTRLLSQQPVSAAISELTNEVREGMEYIDDSLRLLLEVNRALIQSTPRRGVEDKEELIEALNKATNGQSIKRRLERLKRRMNYLEEQKAAFGPLMPANIAMEIDDTADEIEALEKKLRGGE